MTEVHESVDRFATAICFEEPEISYEKAFEIVNKNHCGDGYFSWDGILDDLAEIFGEDRAANILSEC